MRKKRGNVSFLTASKAFWLMILFLFFVSKLVQFLKLHVLFDIFLRKIVGVYLIFRVPLVFEIYLTNLTDLTHFKDYSAQFYKLYSLQSFGFDQSGDFDSVLRIFLIP